MSLRQDTPLRGKLVRQVDIVGISYTVRDFEDTAYRPVGLTEPDIEVAKSDETPRNAPAWILAWNKGYKNFEEQPKAGSRVSVAGDEVYELLSPPRQLKEHNFQQGYTALAHPLSFLYPVTGNLKQMDGTVLVQDMMLAMWSPGDKQETTSKYRDFDAECPLDYPIAGNLQIDIDETVYTIVSSSLNLAGPRTTMTLRGQTQ